MPDDTDKPAYTAAPPAVPTPLPEWLTNIPAEVLARQREQASILKLLTQHDAARAAAGTTELIAQTDFTILDDEACDGRVVRIGERFTVSDFDLHKYRGRGLPIPAGSPADSIREG